MKCDMQVQVFLFVAFFATINALWNGQSVQRGSGIKLSAPGNKNGTGIRGTGVKLNFTGRSGIRSTAAPDFFNSLNSSTPIAPTPADVFSRDLHVGLVVPYKSFGYREYTKAITSAKSGLQRKLVNLFRKYDLHVHLNMKELTPSPTGRYILSLLKDVWLVTCINICVCNNL